MEYWSTIQNTSRMRISATLCLVCPRARRSICKSRMLIHSGFCCKWASKPITTVYAFNINFNLILGYLRYTCDNWYRMSVDYKQQPYPNKLKVIRRKAR